MLYHKLLFILLLLATIIDPTNAIEATFTPANDPESGSGPLPLSQNQRNELLQLEQVITSSPNPQETLAHVASQNNMSAEELYNLLLKNRQDMQMASGGGGGGGSGDNMMQAMKASAAKTLPRKILGVVYSVVGMILGYGKKEPRRFGMLMSLVLCVLYVVVMAPRTGLVLSTSSKPFFLSNGHTTLLPPPSTYLSKYLSTCCNHDNIESSLPSDVNVGFSKTYLDWLVEKEYDEDADEEEELVEDGEVVMIKQFPKKSKLSMFLASKKYIPLNVILTPTSSEGDEDETKEEELRLFQQTAARNILFDSASKILSTKRFSEFPPSTSSSIAQSLRFHTTTNNEEKDEDNVALLVLKGMGDYNRFGIQPLQISYYQEYEEEDRECIGFGTAMGGHWDGEVCVSILKLEGVSKEDGDDYGDEEDGAGLVVHVCLMIPKKGRKPNKKLATTMINTLLNSITTSITLQSKQTYARQIQSKLYKSSAKNRAAEKRTIKFELERKQEEMARDRRRRWQRQNRDAGRYRPSGKRMQSPNNAHLF